EEFTLEAAQVLVAVTSRPAAVPQRGRWAFPVLVTTVRTSIATWARLTLREDLHPPCSLPTGSARSTPLTCQGRARHCPARKRFLSGSCSLTSSVRNAACPSGRRS